jgi:hypothetical protein
MSTARGSALCSWRARIGEGDSRGHVGRAGHGWCRPAHGGAAACRGPRSARWGNDPPTCVGRVPVRGRRARGGRVHPHHAGQLGRGTGHRSCLEPAPGGDPVAGHGRVLDGFRGGHPLSGRPQPAGAAAGGGPAGRRGRRRDLGRVRIAGCGPRTWRGPVGHRRIGWGEHELPGHSASGHHRRGRNRASVPEPPPAPPGVVSGFRGGDRRGRRRLGPSGQRRIEPGDRVGHGRRPAPGGGVTARPAVSGRGG